jgi:peptide chain release factor 1
MRSLASSEYGSLISTLSDHISTVFPSLLVPQSTTMHLSTIIELKSGVGGSEASLFLSDMLRMYLRFSSSSGWKSHIISSNNAENGRTKDAILEIKGAGSYDALRWESGVHRVQRVPATEASGRVHTSTVAVVVSLVILDTRCIKLSA